MVFIGDFFAIGLVVTLLLFYVESKNKVLHMPKTSKLFVCGLWLTVLTAVIDLIAGYLLKKMGVPLWLNMLVNTLYFIVNIITTTQIAWYFFTKALEHTHEKHCLRNAKVGLTVLFGIYMVIVILNVWTGWLFSFDAAGVYCRGPLNFMGYAITIAQMVLVVICYFRNRTAISGVMRRLLLLLFPAIIFCIVLQRLYPEIMLNSMIIAIVNTVLFLTFQGQRYGVHSLTKLNDRHRFFAEVEHRIKEQEPFQIFLINIKNFGAINQRYGHLFSDEVLYHFAFSLEKLLKGSVSFHMNGTVFATVLRYTYQNVAEQQCGTLLDFMEKGVLCSDQNIDLDYVVGHYIANGNEQSATELYEIIEYAISKATGMKQRYIQCSHEDGKEVLRRRYLKERMQKVDRENGFELWFQPTKCLSTGNFCSMEALIRLRETDGSLISPAEFIPLAEQSGQISTITWFVLEEVCRILKTTPELSDVSVSINMPMEQLLEKGFIPRFTGIVDQAGIAHRRICIEFTERAILENFHQILQVMEDLTQDGFRFYLDDFGSGYSNFHCLLQLPFQIIKLDKCLMQPAAGIHRMVYTMTKMFHAMGLTVIAEGAETEEEVQYLADQGVDRIQGFALARPMPMEQLLKFYEEHPFSNC